jgi:3-dehydroquinate dehydratase
MTKVELQKKIKKLLKTSIISDHTKTLIDILLYTMELKNLVIIYNALATEHKEIALLDQQKKRLDMQFMIMIEKINKIELEKARKKAGK